MFVFAVLCWLCGGCGVVIRVLNVMEATDTSTNQTKRASLSTASNQPSPTDTTNAPTHQPSRHLAIQRRQFTCVLASSWCPCPAQVLPPAWPCCCWGGRVAPPTRRPAPPAHLSLLPCQPPDGLVSVGCCVGICVLGEGRGGGVAKGSVRTCEATSD